MIRSVVLGGLLLSAASAASTATDRGEGYVTICRIGESCSVIGSTNVAFGASGQFVFKVLNGSFDCTVATFGSDPIPGRSAKECSIRESGRGSMSPLSTGSSTGSSCSTGGSQITVNKTIHVTSGTYDGGCRRFSAGSGLGGQWEAQEPLFQVENGATLRNVVIDTNGTEGIHVYNGAVLDNIHWLNAVQDAITIESSGAATVPMAMNPLVVAPAWRKEAIAEATTHAEIRLQQRVTIKYRFLLSDLNLNAQASEKLAKYLLEREAITQAAETASEGGNEDVSDKARLRQQRLAEIDADVQALLKPSDQASYTALKDSDVEQQRLSEYLGGIRNVAPLDERQERAVLEAKLRQKQRYQMVARDCALDRDVLSAAQREYAHVNLARGLKQYLDDFLVESAPVLTHEQFVLLRSYETTEFTLELDRLQRKINAK